MAALLPPSPAAAAARAMRPASARRGAATTANAQPQQKQLTGPAAWIDAHLSAEHGRVVAERRLGGSSWASFGEVDTASGARFFVKTAGSDAAAAEMFRGEMLGLNALRDASDAAGAGLAVPRVFYGGGAPQDGSANGSSQAFIVMEWLDLSASGGGGGGGGKPSLQARLGEALARMHNAPAPTAGKFGFAVDNTIGGTPQPNQPLSDSWVDFYREKRLRFQLRLAGDASLTNAAAPVLDNLELLFRDYGPGGALEGQLVPSVLHGDLWSGNYGPSGSGAPAIFDPAVYYGHSEAEFGMSWCAGFSGEFWAAYDALRPPAPGFEARRDLYKLYHYLNHLNLFGGGYRGECVRCIDRLAAVVKAGGVPAR